jgi:hypothetical protein
VLCDGVVVVDCLTLADAYTNWAGEDDEHARRFGCYPRRSTLYGVAPHSRRQTAARLGIGILLRSCPRAAAPAHPVGAGRMVAPETDAMPSFEPCRDLTLSVDFEYLSGLQVQSVLGHLSNDSYDGVPQILSVG